MTHLNPPYLAPFAYEQPTAPEQTFVLAWLYRLRAWLGLCSDIPLEDMEGEYQDAGYRPWEYERPAFIHNRARRRCGSAQAESYYILETLQPRGLSSGQMQERLSRVSTFGRVRIYGISTTCSVLLRRPLLNCYDHGWWRAPLLCALAETSRPP